MQRYCTQALLFLLTTLSTHLFAQEPVVGVDDPEALFVDSDPGIHKNKQATLHIMRDLLQCGQWEKADQWLTERYIQHNPNAQSGREAVKYFFQEVLKVPRINDCPKLTVPIVAVTGEDDLVTVLIAKELKHPTKQGETYTTTWFDTWRFVDGKADEHWDPAEIMIFGEAPVSVDK